MKKIILSVLFLALPMALVHAASDYYLKLGGIEGEATTDTPAAPTITVSGNLTVEAGTLSLGGAFILDGTKSQDDGTVQRFSWKQVGGPVVRFADPSAITQSVTPTVAGTYVFELSVTDATGLSSVARRIEVKVTDVAAVSDERGGTEDITIGVGEVEQTASDMYLEIKDVDGEAKKGNVEINWKVEEGEKGRPAENDRLINAGPTTDWPKEGLHVAADDVNGLTEDEKRERLSTVKEWAEIQSGQDLQNFAAGVLLEDVRMKGVKIQENVIDVEYSMPAKLFGLISTEYRASISINRGDNDNWDFGNVKVKFPWYSFLLRKGMSVQDLTDVVSRADSVEAEGELAVDTEGAEEKKEDGKEVIKPESWSFGSAAKALRLVSNVLKTKHDTVKNSIGNIR